MLTGLSSLFQQLHQIINLPDLMSLSFIVRISWGTRVHHIECMHQSLNRLVSSPLPKNHLLKKIYFKQQMFTPDFLLLLLWLAGSLTGWLAGSLFVTDLRSAAQNSTAIEIKTSSRYRYVISLSPLLYCPRCQGLYANRIAVTLQ